MIISHIGIWVRDLELSKQFYTKYFDLICGEKYHNTTKKFSSYFLSFPNSVTSIELMHRPDMHFATTKQQGIYGLAHIAISVGSSEAVCALTNVLRNDNYTIQSEPRTTGDGFFESVVLDPDGNCIEITNE